MGVKIVKLLGNPVTLAFTGGVNPKGAYDAQVIYATGDSVSYNGSSYVAVQSTQDNLPTNTTYWQILASKGDTGSAGATGATGATGAAGTNGTNGVGVPTGGTTGQILKKSSATNYDTTWSSFTTADITDSTDKRYVTDSQRSVLQNTSGTNTGDQDISNLVSKSTTINTKPLTSNITLTTADISSSTDKRYLTDAQLTVVGNTSGINTGDQNLTPYQLKSEKGAALGYASLDSSGKIPSAQIPSLPISNTFVVASEAEMLALAAIQGDIAVRTDESKSYILKTADPTVLANWQELLTSGASVTSVNALTGDVTLTTAEISEGTNLYYTEARVNANTTVAANTAARHTHSNATALDDVSGTNTGDQDLTGLVAKTTTVNAKPLSSNVTLTTADIADSTNKRYITDAQQTVLGNTSGTNTGDQSLANLVVKNAPITASTKTKITYDTKGLVTAGADATTADIADSANRRYVTDAQRTVISNTSGTNTGDQTISDATISLTDITTNNVTTAKHGFVPKAPNDTTKFLRGDGTWTVVPAASVAWGSVTGTLTDQTDLKNALDAKEVAANKGQANGYASLDAGGKVPSSQLPAIAITATTVVADQATMLALTAETGDVAIRTDENKSYILKGTDASNLAHWQELLTPTDTVLSVNGQTGTVSLSTADISDGTDKRYITDAQQTILDGISGTNTGDQDLSGLMVKANNLSDLIDAATARTNLGVSTTANLTDTLNKRFVTDAQKTVLGNTSGTNTGDQDLSNYAKKTVVTVGTANADYLTDGTADHVQIQQALDALNGLGGGTLLIKKGTYNVSLSMTLYSNITIKGEGKGNTIIKSSGVWSGDFFLIGSNLGTSSGANPAGTYNNINFFDLEFDGSSASHSAMALYGTSNVNIARIYMHDGSNYGFYFANPTNLIIKDCIIKDLTGTGTQAGIQFKGAVNCWAINNYVYNNCGGSGVQGLDSHATDGANARTGSGVHILGNYVELCSQGINNEDNNTEIIGNTVINSQGQYGIGLRTNPVNSIIANNVIDGSATAVTVNGIDLYNTTSGCSNIKISGNIIRNMHGTNTSDGIFVGANVTNLTITDNIICNSGRYGVNNRAANVVCFGNKFYDDQGTPTQTQGIFNDTGASIVGLDIAQDPSNSSGSLTTVRSRDAILGQTDKAGGELRLSAGIGTGNANTIISFYTPNPTTSGSTTQGLTEKMRLFGSTNGRLVIGATSISTGLIGDGLTLGGGVARGVQMNRHTTSDTAGNSLTISSGGATPSATNKAAGDLILATGTSTGTGTSQILLKTADVGSTGSSDNSINTRVTIDATGVAVTGALSATNLSGTNTGDKTLADLGGIAKTGDTGIGNLGLDGTAARDITVSANADGQNGVALVIASGSVTPGGTSTDKAGGELRLKAGAGTGSNGNSILTFYTSPATGAGTGAQTPTEKMRITSSSNARVCIGTTTASYDGLNLGGNVTRTVGMVRHTTDNTAGNSLTLTAGGTKGGNVSTDKAGGNLILQGGLSTGTGTSSVVIQTPTPGTTGTGDNTLATRGTFSSTGLAVVGAVSATTSVTGTNLQYNGMTVLANDTLAQALATNINTKLTVTANRTLTTTVPAAGVRCSVLILTSGTSSYTITFGSGFKSTGTLATGTADAKVFVVSFISDGTNLYETGRTAAMAA